VGNPWAFGWTQLLTLIGFAITIGIAVGGFRTFGRWRREKLEERRIEAALDALTIAHETKFIFQNIAARSRKATNGRICLNGPVTPMKRGSGAVRSMRPSRG
jgi:hypothetical protein